MAELSIIVTSYNIENYIGECLDSIVNQTFADTEIIVVDDGSTDSSPDIIREYAERDERIVPVLLGTNSPGGVATAANAGLDRATSPWVGFADGDDLFELDAFGRLLEAARTYDADLAMCNYRDFSDGSEERMAPADEKRWADLDQDVYTLTEDNRRRFLRFVAVPWRKLYRRSFLEEHHIRFPVGDYFFEDNPFHWFCLVQANKIAVVPDVLCYHRVARAGQTMQTADARLFKIFQHHETIYRFLESISRLDLYKTTLLSWVISQMEWISRRTPLQLRRQFFDVLRQVFAHYTMTDVNRALTEGSKGTYARHLSEALIKNNFAGFNQTLDGNTKKQNAVMRGWYHLRYSGPKRTAQITAKYAKQQIERRTSGRKAPVVQRGVSNEQLLFALAVLDQRLDSIERQLRERRR
ncbi:MAG TPA: glycosyltransferase family 2 protein [Propionibacteriaceae bacterium]|nr:glycosyltransferase family 2 protein [Propionibacteriaceae bacterium]